MDDVAPISSAGHRKRRLDANDDLFLSQNSHGSVDDGSFRGEDLRIIRPRRVRISDRQRPTSAPRRPRADEETKSQTSAASGPRAPVNFSLAAPVETRPLPAFEFVFGPEASELEDRENPILPDEIMSTREDFCYICEAKTRRTSGVLQSAPTDDPIEFIVNWAAPMYAFKSIRAVTASIRQYYNGLIRPHLAPEFKQRWTLKQIFMHFFYHSSKYIDVLMKRACTDIMFNCIATGLVYNPDCPRETKVNKDLVPVLMKLYGVIKDKV